MQLAQYTGIGLLVIGGLLAVLLRSGPVSGIANAVAQTVAGIVLGLLGAFAILMWTADLIPDDLEWVGTVAVVMIAFALVIAIKLRSRA